MNSDRSLTRSKSSPPVNTSRVIEVQAFAKNDFLLEKRKFNERLKGKFTAILWIPIPLVALGFSQALGLGMVAAQILLSVFFLLCIVALLKWMWNTPIKCFCGECKKYVPSDIEWKCGFCDQENKETDRFSFLNKCQNCEKEPPAYQCHHCDSPVFLDHEREVRNIAVKLGEKVVVNRDAEAQAVKASRLERKEELEFEIQIASLNKQLAELKAVSQPVKSKMDSLRDDVDERIDRIFGTEKLAQEKLKEVESDPYFANNPERLGRFKQIVEHWRDQNLI